MFILAHAPNNSYGVPCFVERGYYQDLPFTCVGCGSKEIWRAAQQKWWYEVAKGYAGGIHCGHYCRTTT